MYHLVIKPKAEKALDKIPVEYREKFSRTFRSLIKDPFQGKKLEGELKGKYSIRVWPYRILYEVYKKELIVSVVDVGHRQSVYKR